MSSDLLEAKNHLKVSCDRYYMACAKLPKGLIVLQQVAFCLSLQLQRALLFSAQVECTGCAVNKFSSLSCAAPPELPKTY